MVIGDELKIYVSKTATEPQTHNQPTFRDHRVVDNICVLCVFAWLSELVVCHARIPDRLRLGFIPKVGKSTARRRYPYRHKPRVALDSQSSSSLTRG